MSQGAYAQLSTTQLIERFISEANHIGGPLSPSRLKVPVRSAEFVKGRDGLHAMGDILRNRKPVGLLRQHLFESDSADVRSWAGTLLHEADPEWAEAAVNGLFHGLTTQEVLAWRRRLLQPVPHKPNCRDMSVVQLVECFIDACERCYGATRFLNEDEGGGTSMKAYNAILDESRTVTGELKRRGELAALLPLLDHPMITVRQQAATLCTAVAPERSIPVLKDIESTKTFPEFAFASTVLDQFRQTKSP